MKKRISKRVREEAALILAICASQETCDGAAPERMFITDAGDETSASEAAEQLAGEALVLPDLHGVRITEEQWRAAYAEAEALLRDGWEP